MAKPAPDGHAGYFNGLATIVPAGSTDCELLYAAGADGVWVRNLVPPPFSNYVPSAQRNATLP